MIQAWIKGVAGEEEGAAVPCACKAGSRCRFPIPTLSFLAERRLLGCSRTLEMGEGMGEGDEAEQAQAGRLTVCRATRNHASEGR